MKTHLTDSSFPAARKSCSAEASRASELARLRGMTVEQRIREALSLKKKIAGLNPHPKA